MNSEFGPKEGSVVAQFRMDLEGRGETSVGSLDFLSKLPEIERHLPLIVISSVSSRAKGKVEPVNLRQPVASVILVFPNLEDFLKSVGNKGKTPNGIAIKIPLVSDLYLAGEEEKLKSLVNRLSQGRSGHQKTVWFVEEDEIRRPLTKEEKEAKKAVVRRFGLVGAKCHQDKETGLVYVVARPKKKAERGESDLTQRPYFAPPKRLPVLEKPKQSEVHICPDCGERMSFDEKAAKGGRLVCPNHLRHDRRG